MMMMIQFGSVLALVQTADAAMHSNADVIAALNADASDNALYSLDGPFASMSPAEFRAQVLLPPRTPPQKILEDNRASLVPMAAPLPDIFDWQALGAVTSVKNQGTVGTCWAFSTAANIEGQYFVRGQGKLTNFSVEQLVECDASDDPNGANSYGAADCGVFGGWPYLAFDYVAKSGGLYLWDTWPYCVSPQRNDGVPQCWPCMPKGYSIQDCGGHADFYCDANTTAGQGPPGKCSSNVGAVGRVSGWQAASTNETEIAKFMMDTGPLSVLLNAGKLQFYKEGVYSPARCDPSSLDHAVLLVGFGTDPDAGDYWRVKNSWGEGWGENGYFRISRGTGACGINTAVTTAVV